MPDTRSGTQRLDDHDLLLQKIQLDIETLKMSMTQGQIDNQKEQIANADFRNTMIDWMTKLDKRSNSESGSPESVVSPLQRPIFTENPLPPKPPIVEPLKVNTDEPIITNIATIPWAVKKVKLPEFYGYDPQGWIQKASLYFDINGISSSELRVRLAQLSMTGVATHWFTIVKELYDPLLWDQLQAELLERFSGLDVQNPYEQLSTFKQGSSIYDYIDEFEYLLSLVPKLPESQSLGYFIGGLKEDVKQWVRLHQPKSRLEAMTAAKNIELLLRPSSDQNQQRFRYQQSYSGGFRGGGGPLDRRPNSINRWDSNRPSFQQPVNKISPTAYESKRPESSRSSTTPQQQTAQSSEFANLFNRNRGVRSLSKTEYEDRRKKGLCYRCGQQFGPSHKCPEAKLRVLLLGDDEDYPDDGGMNAMMHPDVIPEQNDGDIPSGTCLTLAFFGAISGHKTGGKSLKLEGLIGEIPAILMVDSGATHNFVSRKLLKVIGATAECFSGINIKLGDGHVVFIDRIIPQLLVNVQGCEFLINALVFEMGNLDMVLGMEWLKSLGDVIHNWEKATMKFRFNNKEVFLQGITTNDSYPASLQSCLSATDTVFLKADSVCTKLPSLPQLSAVQSKQVDELCEEYATVFKEPTGLPPMRQNDHSITLKTSGEPICVRPYRYPHVQKTEIERQVQELLKLGMIRPSTSSFSGPVILVKKKDNSWRMCVDYRALNKATIPDKFPIPVVDELIDELHGAVYFSKLDLKSGYNQIRMEPTSIDKTAFRTHDGQYEFLVMPFGLTNAPTTFQAIMNDIFRPLLRKSVVVFFDDILIYSPTWQQHLEDVKIALEVLLHHQFVVNKKKCAFGQTSIEYLGHIIHGGGVAMDPKKIEAVLDWPIPKSIKGLRGFLGLTGYYRKFIRHYGSIARPLTELTKKDAFGWNSDAQAAFETLKEAMVTAPLLGLPNFTIPFVVECDASGRGIGAVLMQQQKPLAYFSKSLSDRNLAKSAYEREIMALVLSVQHWGAYLLGTKFVVYTDQKSLKFLLHQRITTPDQQNWVAKLLGYDFDICYKPGRENRVADALSRRDEEGELKVSFSYPVWAQGAKLLEEISADQEIQKQREAYEKNPLKFPDFLVRNGVLFYKNRLVISKCSKFIPELIREFHQAASGGHSGYYRTYRRLAANIYWPGMMAVVQEFVRACEICQRCKASSTAPGGLLQPLPIPQAIWEDLSIDFIVGLPKSKGYDAILVVVDRLSKYSHFILLRHPYTAKSIAEVFVREVIRHHGIPKSIVSDRDPLFLSAFWREIFKSQGTKLNMSSAYHPESDGQTEVINRCLEAYLRCFAVDQPRNWASWIPWAEFWYNSTFHISTGVSPFEVVYGRKPPSVMQFVPGEIRVQAVLQELLDRDEAIKQLKLHLGQAQSNMKEQADKKRRDVSFQVGEWVYVKLKPYRQMSVAKRIHHKLAAKFFGPFQVVDRIGPVAYKLDLPATSKIHPVFHVSLLKKAVQVPTSPVLPPELEITGKDSLIPMSILASRTITEGEDVCIQWLIQWKDQSMEEATWEDAVAIKSQFPDISLEDKTVIEGEGNDGDREILAQRETQPRKTYQSPFSVLYDDIIYFFYHSQVIVSGKLRAQRAKSVKFKDGYMVSSGQPVMEYIVRHVLLRQVKIMLHWDPTGKLGPKTPY
ncbi:hypothetical protein LXL04_025668 [Taraxacum kok-saghyz]